MSTNSHYIDIKDSMFETFQDILSMEYINDLIYGHPERLHDLDSILKQMGINLTPHVVMTIIFDNFWTICENKDNSYRYRLKRNLLNNTRKILGHEINAIASSLIGTDKIIILLDCEHRPAKVAEIYAEDCAKKIVNSLNRQLDFSVSIGISNYCNTPALLWRAYEQSFRSLENSFQMGNGQVFKYKQLSSKFNGELSKSDQEETKRNFIISISTQNYENCINTLNNFSAKLSLQNVGASYTKSLVVVMLSEIARYCIKIGLDSTEVSEKIILFVNDIFKAETMNDIKKETLSFIYYLSGKIKNDLSENNVLTIAKTYIEQYYMDDITLPEIATMCGYNPSYFSRSFKEFFGINFVQYLMKVRLDNSKKLLENSDLSITIICQKTGFQSISYFSSTFKREIGMSPHQFRSLMN